MSFNLFWGYGCENILGDLSEDFLGRGSNNIYIDPTNDTIPNTDAAPINFLTSNHFTRTKYDLNDNYPEFKIKHDFYDLVKKIKFSNLFFFIHDHSDLLVLDEPSALLDFTVVVSPWPAIHKNIKNINLFCCDIAFKNIMDFNLCTIKRKAVWFVSNIKFNVEKFGIDGFSNEILKIIEGCEISIKLPEYGVISSSLEKNLIKNGIEIIPSSISSERIILETEKVISSSFSGVAALARYYKKECIIVKNTHPNDFRQPPSILDDYATWLGNPTIIENNAQMKSALRLTTKRENSSHRCGVFRDDFIEKYYDDLFHTKI